MTRILPGSLFVSAVWPALLLCAHLPAAAEQTRFVNPDNGLVGWRLTREGLGLELIQRLPDQTRGFFLARGFTAELANDIGESCVFQTIARNIGSGTDAAAVNISLPQWRIEHAGRDRPIKLKEQWDQSWGPHQVTPAARLAFRWATFPTEQTFASGGDYGWGMISFDLPPGEAFDLQVVWMQGDKRFTERLRGIVCAPDR